MHYLPVLFQSNPQSLSLKIKLIVLEILLEQSNFYVQNLSQVPRYALQKEFKEEGPSK